MVIQIVLIFFISIRLCPNLYIQQKNTLIEVKVKYIQCHGAIRGAVRGNHFDVVKPQVLNSPSSVNN